MAGPVVPTVPFWKSIAIKATMACCGDPGWIDVYSVHVKSQIYSCKGTGCTYYYVHIVVESNYLSNFVIILCLSI